MLTLRNVWPFALQLQNLPQKPGPGPKSSRHLQLSEVQQILRRRGQIEGPYLKMSGIRQTETNCAERVQRQMRVPPSILLPKDASHF